MYKQTNILRYPNQKCEENVYWNLPMLKSHKEYEIACIWNTLIYCTTGDDVLL